MPRRPKYSRKKRFYRRRRAVPPLALWPRSRVTKGTIINTSTWSSAAAGAIGGIAIKINSLNDPMGSVGTNLPLGLDEASRLYRRYKILGAKLSVVGHPVTITGAAVFGAHITRESTMLTDIDHYRELKGTVSRMVSPDIDLFKMAIKYSPKRLFKFTNVKDVEDLEASLIGTGSVGNPAPADPTNLAYVHLFLQDANKTDSVTGEITVRIDYIIQLLDPITPSRSSL